MPNNTQDNRRLIKCLASHNNQIFTYDEERIIEVKPSCKLCNGTGWAFRQDVIDHIDKKYEAEPPKQIKEDLQNSSASPVQQLKAEIAAFIYDVEAGDKDNLPRAVNVFVDKMRRLSAIE